MRFMMAILVTMTISCMAKANEISPIVTQLFDSGIKYFTCEIVGREIQDTASGFKKMSATRHLQPRAILASSEDEATKLCLLKMNASLGYGPRNEGTGVLFVIFVSDIPELKLSKHNLFVADEIKVKEIKAF